MINKRATLIVSFFIMLSVASVVLTINITSAGKASQKALSQKSVLITEFKEMSYFLLKDGKQHISFDSLSLNITNNQYFSFEKPIGRYYSQSHPLNFKSLKGQFESGNERLLLNSEVELTGDGIKYNADEIQVDGKSSFITAEGNITSELIDKKTKDTIFIESNSMNGWLNDKRTTFKGRVIGRIKRKRAFEKGMSFKSEQLEFDGIKSLVNLEGNVELNRNSYHLRANKAEIFLENFNKRLKYYALYDDIELTERFKDSNGDLKLRKAYSEKLEGFISLSKVVLSGAPRVEQENDVIKGNQITLREKVQLIEVDDSKSFFQINKGSN